MAFEKKLNEGKGSEQARRCWEEMKKDTQKGENKIEMGGRKEEFLREKGSEDRGEKGGKKKKKKLGLRK